MSLTTCCPTTWSRQHWPQGVGLIANDAIVTSCRPIRIIYYYLLHFKQLTSLTSLLKDGDHGSMHHFSLLLFLFLAAVVQCSNVIPVQSAMSSPRRLLGLRRLLLPSNPPSKICVHIFWVLIMRSKYWSFPLFAIFRNSLCAHLLQHWQVLWFFQLTRNIRL